MRAMIFASLAFPGRYFMLHDSCARRGADEKWRVFARSSRNVALHGRARSLRQRGMSFDAKKLNRMHFVEFFGSHFDIEGERIDSKF